MKNYDEVVLYELSKLTLEEADDLVLGTTGCGLLECAVQGMTPEEIDHLHDNIKSQWATLRVDIERIEALNAILLAALERLTIRLDSLLLDDDLTDEKLRFWVETQGPRWVDEARVAIAQAEERKA